MASELIGYFGFGSLVNRETLRTSYVDTIPARLHGWQRHWQGRQAVGDQSVVLLSIHGHAKTHIDGMLVIDRIENLDAVSVDDDILSCRRKTQHHGAKRHAGHGSRAR